MVMKAEVMIVLVGVLATASATDLGRYRIPNWLTFPAMVAGLGLNTIAAGARGLLFSIEGLFLGMGLFIILYCMGGMGAGDVKLMGAVWSMLGPHMVLTAALCTTVVGGIYALAIIALHPAARATRAAMKGTMIAFLYSHSLRYDGPVTEGGAPKLSYGVVIAVGTMAAVILKRG
jgi:prepilin peptidase CpaA